MALQSILLIEDEPLIAMMLEDFLEALGKRVIGPADNLADGLALIAAGGIDAAIVDVHLHGGQKSWPIAEALAKIGIPFIFASGGSSEALPEKFGNRAVLEKPFTMDDVERALSALG